MDNKQFNKIIYDRIDIMIQNFVNKYPKSFSTNIINDMMDKLEPTNAIIRFSIKIWQLNPSQILSLNDIIDISILFQLSYETYLLFIDMPDMCNYSNLGQTQIQLSIIWLSAFLMSQSTDIIYKLQKKHKNNNDANFFTKIGNNFQEIIMNHHNHINTFQELSTDLIKRRYQIMNMVKTHDKLFYQELIFFMFCILVNKQTNIMQYQKDIMNKIDTTYYIELREMIHKNKKRKKTTYIREKCNIRVSDKLYDIYYELYTTYLTKGGIGVPFQ